MFPFEEITMNQALIMLDFQRDFCDPGGYADMVWGTAWVAPVIPIAHKLLQAARRHGLLVIHTREGYAPDLEDCYPFKQTRYKKAGAAIGTSGSLGRVLIRGEYGHDITDLLKPAPGEIIIDKNTFSAFCGTNLERILRDKQIERIAMAGVTADACVHSTLRAGTDLGFYCYYVVDAISTADPELRAACARMILHEGGIVGDLITADELISEWSRA